MASTINAGTTTATALNITTDTTGALNIQTSGTNAISISNAQVVSLTNPLLPASGGTGITSLGTGVATALGQNVTGSGGAVLASSPTLTGIPVAPTATVGTNTTQLATTAFVIANVPASPIPVGTVMLFYQAAAPTGWTQVTTQNDKALRVVSGTGGSSSGTTAFSSVFTNQTVSTTISTSISGTTGATTLSTAQIPSHTHPSDGVRFIGGCASAFTGGPFAFDSPTGATGGGGSHTHSFSGSGSGSGTSTAVTLNVQYIDIIICSKN
jgi:hypothetical protein